MFSIHSRAANIEMLKSKVSSENYYLHDFGAQTSSNISEHELIYGFEQINNYVQGLVDIFSHLVIQSLKNIRPLERRR